MLAKNQAASTACILLFMAVAGCIAAMHVPPATRVAVHFGLDGHANGWMSPWAGYLFMPACGACVWLVLAVAPYLDPRAENLRRSEAAYGAVWLAVTLLMAAIQAAIIAIGAGYPIGIQQLAGFGLGGFFVAAGNVIGKIRPNNVVGIRTPWTRADDRVWDRTHRLGGFVFVMAGLAMIALGWLVRDPHVAERGLAFIMVVAVAVPIASSYWIWRGQKNAAVLS